MSGSRTKRIILGCCLAGCLGGAVAAWYIYCVWPAHRAQLAAWPHWDQLVRLATCAGWAAVVLLVAFACWLVHFVYQKKRRQRFADTAARLRLNYSANALPSLSRLQTLDILRTLPAPMTLRHHLYGVFRDFAVNVVECRGQNRDRDTGQTLVIFSLNHQLPVFRMSPQFGSRLARALQGETGTMFWSRDPISKGKQEEPDIPKPHPFHGFYKMTIGYSVAQRRLVDSVHLAASPATRDTSRLEKQVRRLFDESLLEFFTRTPGWSVESSGRQLALWRAGFFVSPEQLGDFLLAASVIADRLCDSWRRPMTSAELHREVDVVSGTQSESLTSTYWWCVALGGVFGIAAGTLFTWTVRTVAGWHGVPAWFRQADDLPVLLFLAPSFIVGAIIGSVIGAKVLVPALRRRWQGRD